MPIADVLTFGNSGTGSTPAVFIGSVALAADDVVWLCAAHDGSLEGTYQWRDNTGTVTLGTTYTTFTTPGGVAVAIARYVVPAAGTYGFYCTFGAGGGVSKSNYSAIGVVLRGQRTSSDPVTAASVVNTSSAAATLNGPSLALASGGASVSFAIKDSLYDIVTGTRRGAALYDTFRSAATTNPVVSGTTIAEQFSLTSASTGSVWSAALAPAAAPGPAPQLTDVSSALNTGSANVITVTGTIVGSTSGMTVTLRATAGAQEVTGSTTITGQAFSGTLTLPPGEPWTVTATATNSSGPTTAAAGSFYIRSLSGQAQIPSTYSETALAWRDWNTNDVVSALQATVGTPITAYLAVTTSAGDMLPCDQQAVSTSNAGVATVTTTNGDGQTTITPVAAGTCTITVTRGTFTATLTLTVAAAIGGGTAPTITTDSALGTLTVGQTARIALVASQQCVWSHGSLPTGFDVLPSGQLVATPVVSGSVSFTVTATNAQGLSATKTLNATVVSAPVDPTGPDALPVRSRVITDTVTGGPFFRLGS